MLSNALTRLYNWLTVACTPRLPTLAEAKLQEIGQAERSLLELELHHLHTLKELEHYGAARAELEARLERLRQ